jgi:hypothetical protein
MSGETIEPVMSLTRSCEAPSALKELSIPILGRAVLAEREREQTRAQQHEPGCRQCEESVRDEVMITHDTPATLNAGPNSLKFSKSAFSKGVLWFPRVQALERKPSNAWARKMPALISPRNAVTVSIIAKIHCFPARRERHAAAHSQRDSPPRPKIGPD